jgi:hypothetical protein
VLYPWVAFSILMWCGPNFIFRTNFIQYCEFAAVLTLYDRAFLRRVTAPRETIVPVSMTFLDPVRSGLDRGIF